MSKATSRQARPCYAPGCAREVLALGLCRAHYQRLRRNGSLEVKSRDLNLIARRFWSHVDVRRPAECWEWRSKLTTDGYGSFSVRGEPVRAHRFSYTLTKGEIPDGLLVLHSCDNRPCVNPAHLSVGTSKDNAQDMVRRGRTRKASTEPCSATGCTQRAAARGMCTVHYSRERRRLMNENKWETRHGR